MATKNTKSAAQPPATSPSAEAALASQAEKAEQPAKPATKPAPAKSSAKAMQERSEKAVEQPAIAEERLATTLRTEVGFEYHLDLPRSVVTGILDPDTADAFLEVPCPRAGSRRFLHTSYVKEIDVRGLE